MFLGGLLGDPLIQRLCFFLKKNYLIIMGDLPLLKLKNWSIFTGDLPTHTPASLFSRTTRSF
jgi:hypothetical protein